jgi:flagellar hook-associated protein 1 FlgK
MSGLFSIFNVANRGMNTQQRAINVTSHNIANANTEGYSRQRAIIETTRPFGMPSMNSVAEPGQVGTGAQVAAIQRVRDSFLDYQVRVETSRYGQFEAKDKFLSEVESIFNEPSDTGISSLVGKFFDSWHTLSGSPESSNSRTIVVQQSAALADALNHTATQLTDLRNNINGTEGVVRSTTFEVNNILDQINQLNQQIIGVKVAGQMPNDLMDRRDLLIDKLSSKFNIEKVNKNFEGIDINLVTKNADGTETRQALIKAAPNDQVGRLSFITEDNIIDNGDGTYNITYFENGDSSKVKTASNVALTTDQVDNMKKFGIAYITLKADGSVDKIDSFTPSDGEFFGYAEVQQDIDQYQDKLDQIAKALAFAVNTVHSGKTDSAADTLPFFVNSKDKTLESQISASNIAVNKELLDDVMKLNAGFSPTSGSTDGSRALAIAQLRNKLLKVQNINSGETDEVLSRADMFNSTKGKNVYDQSTGVIRFDNAPSGMKIDNYFKDVIDTLGVQGGEAKRMVKNQQSLLASFQETKESISGVSIDEEMANLIQFQHAYQANAKIISTVDELLDVVINGLKR